MTTTYSNKYNNTVKELADMVKQLNAKTAELMTISMKGEIYEAVDPAIFENVSSYLAVISNAVKIVGADNDEAILKPSIFTQSAIERGDIDLTPFPDLMPR